MKLLRAFVTALVIFSSSPFLLNCFCQDNNADKEDDIRISDIPTKEEIKKEFKLIKDGKHNLYSAIPKIGSKKDNSVKTLEGILFPSGENDTVSLSSTEQIFAIFILETISSAKANNVLIQAAGTHPDKNVRAEAISKLSWNIYQRVKNGDVKPDKEIVHVLLNSADDTTYIENKTKRIGEIAREGLKNWTGQDYGDLPKEPEKIQDNTIEQYRENWWQENSKRLKWNKETFTFELKSKS